MKIQSSFLWFFLLTLPYISIGKEVIANVNIDVSIYDNTIGYFKNSTDENRHLNLDDQQQVQSKNIRRHYIVAVDISGTFISKLRSTPILKESLIGLFQNRIPSFSVSKNSKNISNESKNEIQFFDPKVDEISYFQFGVTQSEMESLRWDKYETNKEVVLHNFKKNFIRDKQFTWGTQNSINNTTIPEYFQVVFDAIPKNGFGNGVTLSNYVYPLVLDAINSEDYAQEYILIIVSDFLTGSQFGNKNDFLRLRDIYRYSYNNKLPINAAPNLIKEYIDNLSNAFYPVDYFEYAFRAGKENIGLIAYKIKPKAGKLYPEDISMFIDGNVALQQLDYKGNEFNFSPTQLRFIHNDKLHIETLSLSIKTNVDSFAQSDFNFSIGELKENEEWESLYTTNDTFMNLDSTTMSYTIPKLKEVPLKNQRLGDVALTYTANINYNPFPNSGNGINYAFKTTRNLSAQDIEYASKSSIIMFTYVLPIALIIGLLILLIIIAKPKKMVLEMGTKVNDSFEETNYKNKVNNKGRGRQLVDYLRWDAQKENQIFIIGSTITLGNSLLRSIWRNKIYIKILQEKSAPGYEIRLIHEDESIAGSDSTLKVEYSNSGNFDFYLELKKVDTLAKVDRRIKFEFVLEAHYEKSFLFFSKSLKSNPLKYSFYIGPELGNSWVGIDPGTTGSCIAAGADGYSEVFIPKTTDGEDLIIPSMVTFLTGADQDELTGALNYEDVRYFYGDLAKKNSSRVQYTPVTYRSIKKLLGFTDKVRLAFTKRPIVSHEFEGKELCSLLVKGVYQELKDAVEQGHKKELLTKGQFMPKRAIVAIPNNFTAQKMQDIIDSVQSLQQFEEIRCIYEAEANLMYYIFGVKKTTENKTVLLFDMGGATINVTVASVKEKKIGDGSSYMINILGKLGYGIGGDTIDYVIINFLSKYLNDLGVYVDPFDFTNDSQLKERLVSLAFSIKLEIIDNYDQSNTVLIDNIKLGSFINTAFGTSIYIDDEDAVMQAFTRQEGGIYPFFEDNEVKALLYDNVDTVVKDILAVSSSTIDQVIFSGRSVVFPEIQKTVLNALNQTNAPEVHSLSIDELKSAVAKGACLYGMNRSRVHLNSVKVNSWFGVKHTISANDFNLIKLIPMGASYREIEKGVRKIKQKATIESDFGLDGGMVNFYQIMGANPIASLQKEEKHKYNLLQQVRIDSKSEGVGVEVSENDDVVCEVKEKGAAKEKHFSTLVGDHEVGDANDKHYTWIIK